MTLDNVGIGTASPSTLLHTYGTGDNFFRIQSIRDASETTGMQFYQARGATTALNAGDIMQGLSFWPYVSGDTYEQSAQISAVVEAMSTNSRKVGLAFYTAASGTGVATEKVRIDGNGNVGIGTTTPQNTLNVVGTGNITGATYLLNSKCSAGQVLKADGTTGLVSCVADANSGGTVTSVTGTAPIVSSGGTTPAISATILKDVVATAPLLVDGVAAVNDVLLGADSDLTFSMPAASSGVNGYMTGTYATKLDGIEAGATADMTAAEILTAIKTVDGSGSGLDADLLDGHDTAYFQTALTNPVTGTGTAGYLTKWASGSAVNASGIFELAGNVGIGTATPARKLSLVGGNFTVSNDTVARSDIYWDGTNNRLVILVA